MNFNLIFRSDFSRIGRRRRRNRTAGLRFLKQQTTKRVADHTSSHFASGGNSPEAKHRTSASAPIQSSDHRPEFKLHGKLSRNSRSLFGHRSAGIRNYRMLTRVEKGFERKLSTLLEFQTKRRRRVSHSISTHERQSAPIRQF